MAKKNDGSVIPSVNDVNLATFIYVTFRVEGVHHWPSAPDNVEFLRSPHRHMFHFKVMVRVIDADREVEFFTLKHKLEQRYGSGQFVVDFDTQSCEMIAEELLGSIYAEYGAPCMVDVSEDGENGAVCRIESSTTSR